MRLKHHKSGPLLAALMLLCFAVGAPAAALSPGTDRKAKVQKMHKKLKPGRTKAAYEIRLRRGACYGRCPEYSLRIANGEVEFIGERNVAAAETLRGRADAPALAQLLSRLRDPALAQLRNIYRPGKPGCGTVTTDMASSVIDWRLDGQSHHIELYQGCEGAPVLLRELPSAIDAAANSAHWIQDGADR